MSCIMAYQDFSQIEKIYSKEEARTMMNLSEITYILSCKDPDIFLKIADFQNTGTVLSGTIFHIKLKLLPSVPVMSVWNGVARIGNRWRF